MNHPKSCFRICWCVANVGILILVGGLILPEYLKAAETVVSNGVDADTWITWESDNAGRGDENHGDDDILRVRSGNNDLTNAVRKPLIRLDITGQTINPNQLYIFEVTSDEDGSSSSLHTVNAITDPALQNFDELALTWNNASPCAGYVGCMVALGNEQVANFNAAGPAVGTFAAPDLSFEPIQIVILGAALTDAVFDDGGSSFLTFGIGGSNNSTLDLQSKESTRAPPAPARLLTFDVFESVASGLVTDGSTWSSSASPAAGNQYAIVNGDVITADGSAAFAGEALLISDGSLNYTASGVHLPFVIVGSGMTVTETTTGEFFLGDVNAPQLGRMILNGELTITAENGGDAGLDMAMAGTGTATVNAESGATLFLTDMSAFQGTLLFNGGGDEVLYEGPPGSDMTLEMNSTGANRLAMSLNDNGGSFDNVIFNQPGEIDHRSDLDRLMSPVAITANANIAIDLTKTFAGNERRLFVSQGVHGTSDISVQGTSADPTAGDVTLNEFETGSTSPDGLGATRLATDSFSGTLTTSGFLNVEIRRHSPAAEIIVNQNARLEFGHRNVENLFTTRAGEVTVNSGGSLEVGYEEDDTHVPYQLHVTTQRGRSGDLTLNDGTTTIMQISGSEATKFDTIAVEGTANLNGTLEVLINPTVPSQTVICGEEGADCMYTPNDGDTFEIISIVPETLAGDYDANGTVGPEDYDLWKETIGAEFDVTADGNNDGVVGIADYTAWRDSLGASGSLTGSIVGDFDSMVIVDPLGVLTGFNVSKVVTPTAVTLMIDAVGGAASVVPEPSALLLASLAVAACGPIRQWRRRRPNT